jgi:hypothetical protein
MTPGYGTTQEKAESTLSKRAARVLARLRNPESEDGYVSRPRLGISTTGAIIKATFLELDQAGFVILHQGNGGWRLVGWGAEAVAAVASGEAHRTKVRERAACEPMTVAVPSKIIGPQNGGSDSSTSSQVAKEELVLETSPDCDKASADSPEPPESAIETAGGLTEPPAAREDDTAASAPALPPELHGPTPFAGKAMDWELWAIARCINHIECLPADARARVAAYVASRYL